MVVIVNNLFQFVDAISASPTVLLDLDDGAPFSVVEGTQTESPDLLDRPGFVSDGLLSGPALWDNRSFPLVLSLNAQTGADAQLAAIQTLIRLCSSPQWLRWQHPSTTNPVFFRTHRTAVKVVDEIVDAKPLRQVTVTIRADYAAYGLPETGSFTVNNDPTNATNPMSYTFPAVKGDVAAPLSLSEVFTGSVGMTGVGSVALPTSDAAPAVQYLDSSVFTPVAGTNYTWSVFTDALMIGGTTRRMTLTGAMATSAPTDSPLKLANATTTLPAGDYRILARLRSSVQGGGRSWQVRMNVGSNTAALSTSLLLGAWQTYRTNTDGSTGTRAAWQDMGVFRLPAAQPIEDAPVGLALPAKKLTFWFDVIGGLSGDTFDVDGFLLVPAALDRAAATRWAVGSAKAGDAPTIKFDGERDQLVPVASTGEAILIGTTLAGGMPVVVPNANNLLHIVRNVGYFVYIGLDKADAITATVAVTWTYYPRYLYMRPATT